MRHDMAVIRAREKPEEGKHGQILGTQRACSHSPDHNLLWTGVMDIMYRRPEFRPHTCDTEGNEEEESEKDQNNRNGHASFVAEGGQKNHPADHYNESRSIRQGFTGIVQPSLRVKNLLADGVEMLSAYKQSDEGNTDISAKCLGVEIWKARKRA